MKKNIFFSFFLFGFLLSFISVFAQKITQDTSKIVKTDSIRSVKWYIYAGIGGVSYSGDLESYQRWSEMFHIGIQSNSKRRINPRLELFYGKIAGQNSLYSFPDAIPNKFFQTQVYGATANVQINIIRNDIFTLYFSQGLGLAGYIVSDKNGNDLLPQTATRELSESYSSPFLMLPTSIGGTAFFQNRCGLAEIGRAHV